LNLSLFDYAGFQYGISGEFSDCFGVLPLYSPHRAGGPVRSPGAVALSKEGTIQEAVSRKIAIDAARGKREESVLRRG
jgi:hypothetical protein